MVTKIVKFLQKLSQKERGIAEELISSIINKEWTGLDIKKLQGLSNVFRVRKGSMRIIFSVEDASVHIIDIDRRKEKTYKGY